MTQTLKAYRRNKQRLISKSRKSQRQQKNEDGQGWFFDDNDNQEVDGYLFQREYDRISWRQELEEMMYNRFCQDVLAALNYAVKSVRSDPRHHLN